MSWSTTSLLTVVLLAAVVNARILINSDGARDPPPIAKKALMARYIMNEAEWTSVGTISARDKTETYPYVSLLSVSDGDKGKGSGVPYVYITPMGSTGRDIQKDDRVTMLMSLAQGTWCDEKGYDPMDPRCARVIFTGRLKKVSETDPDYETAKKAVFGRHEWLAHMPPSHHFYFAKLEIEIIALLDTFGGAKYIELNEYYSAEQSAIEEYARRHQ